MNKKSKKLSAKNRQIEVKKAKKVDGKTKEPNC